MSVRALTVAGAEQVPTIELEFRNGDKQKILPDAQTKIQDLEKAITRVSTMLELKEQYSEMKASPVTGPVCVWGGGERLLFAAWPVADLAFFQIPVGSFKGRRHTYAIYAEEEDGKKRAKGGVKTK